MPTLKPTPVVFRLRPIAPPSKIMVRERIMDVVKRRLERITLVNGYSCDCGTNADEGKIVKLTPETPSMNYWDGDEIAEKADYSRELNTVTLTVELYDKGTENQTSTSISRIARRMSGDVKKALIWNDNYVKIDPTLDGLAQSCKYRASDLVLGLNPESWIGVILDFEVKYYTKIGNPFTFHEE